MAPKKRTVDLEQAGRDILGWTKADGSAEEVAEALLNGDLLGANELSDELAEWASKQIGEGEDDEDTEEPEGEAPKEPAGSATGIVVSEPLPAPAAMTNEQIMARLAQRRAEIADLGKVAKERGIKVSESKPKVADKDRLEEFFDGVGYSTGMRRWAHNRVLANEKRILPVIDLLGELWDQEKLEQCLTIMAEGYRRAKIQSSFPSDAMPEKKVANKVPVAEILPELMANWGPGEFQALRVALDPDQWDDEPETELDNGQQDIEDEESAEEGE